MRYSKMLKLLIGVVAVCSVSGCETVLERMTPKVKGKKVEVPSSQFPNGSSNSNAPTVVVIPFLSKQEAYNKAAELMLAKFTPPTDIKISDYSNSSGLIHIGKIGDAWRVESTFIYTGKSGYFYWSGALGSRMIPMNTNEEFIWTANIDFELITQQWYLESLNIRPI